jgi:hypothetical protein
MKKREFTVYARTGIWGAEGDTRVYPGIENEILCREVDPAFDALVLELVGALNDDLNYLNWHSDDLCGDDLIGDNRLTIQYKNRLETIQRCLTKYYAYGSESDEE